MTFLEVVGAVVVGIAAFIAAVWVLAVLLRVFMWVAFDRPRHPWRPYNAGGTAKQVEEDYRRAMEGDGT